MRVAATLYTFAHTPRCLTKRSVYNTGVFAAADLSSNLGDSRSNAMRAPRRKRPKPRIIQPAPEGVNASELAARITYVGSPEHKTGPSFAGAARPRGDATKCDAALNDRLSDIQAWLQRAFEVQCFGPPWEGDFPRYAWCKVGETLYEARLVNRGLGEYKGWQLEPDEWPDGIDDFDWPRCELTGL
ncbi:MAG: hypothetical protein KY476_00985 [Planctomycetes bacterium]|nr:hypothetical protein [Planctomycetota bacterium]